MIDSTAELGASSSDMMSSTSDYNTTYKGTRGLLTRRSCPIAFSEFANYSDNFCFESRSLSGILSNQDYSKIMSRAL